MSAGVWAGEVQPCVGDTAVGDTAGPARRCAALLVAAPASGTGKTTVVAALARWYGNRGWRVRVFKAGPDFIDPMILARASGAPVHPLDLWMGGEAHCRQLLYEAALEADLILVEGVMGLFDGERSSADLAERFGIPVLAVIDGSAMAGTFGAVAYGLAHYRPGLPFAGVFANRVAGAYHHSLLQESLPPGIRSWGWLAKEAGLALPERYLGLVQAAELEDLEARIARAAEALEGVPEALPPQVVFFPGAVAQEKAPAPGEPAALSAVQAPEALQEQVPGGISGPVSEQGGAPSRLSACAASPIVSSLPSSVPLSISPAATPSALPPLLQGLVIAVAQDAAFSFLYDANLEVLRGLGARLVFFSPLTDAALPVADALYLPGGYPELHLAALAANEGMKAAICAFHGQDRPILAEGGGLLYLLDFLEDAQGQGRAMLGIVPGRAVLRPRLVNLGLQALALPEGGLRGHTFHYAEVEGGLAVALTSTALRPGRPGEAVYRRGRLLASFLHFYFPSNPLAVARLLAPSSVFSTL